MSVRRLLAQRRLAVLLCAATLLLKLLVPAGYMIGSDHGRVAITICPGSALQVMTMAMPGMHADMAEHAAPDNHGAPKDHGPSPDHGKGEQPCAFSSLSAAALGAIDPVQLAALIAFVMAAGAAGTMLPAPRGAAHLRPPLRGPPAYP